MSTNEPPKNRLLHWHWGKILMLWIVVPPLGFAVGFIVAAGSIDSSLQPAFFVFPLAVSIIVMLVITWVWLTGKERR